MPGLLQSSNSGNGSAGIINPNDQFSVSGSRTFWLKSVSGQDHAFDGVTNQIMPVNNAACMSTAHTKYGPNSLNSTVCAPQTAASNKYALMNRDFTCEFWVYLLNWGPYHTGVVGGTGWEFNAGNSYWNGGAWFNWNGYWDIWGNAPYVTTGVLPRNQWVHWSVSRKGVRLYMHVNGVIQAASTQVINASQNINTGWNGTSDVTQDHFWIGCGSGNFFIEDVILYVGKACRAESNFTPAQPNVFAPGPLQY